MSIQRYMTDGYPGYGGLYVLYADHAAEVERLEREIDQCKIDIHEILIERDAAVAREEEAERDCERAMEERDGLEDILGCIAGQFGQEFSGAYGPESIQKDIIDLQENRDIWQSKVEGLEKRAREAMASKERAKEDAYRYEKLRIIGAAPCGHQCLGNGTVVRAQTLDGWVDKQPDPGIGAPDAQDAKPRAVESGGEG